MKKFLSAAVCLCLLVTLFGCAKTNSIKNTIEGNMKTYYAMTDGTWSCDDVSYARRLEIKGRLYNAACDSVYVYLSNKVKNGMTTSRLSGSVVTSSGRFVR